MEVVAVELTIIAGVICLLEFTIGFTRVTRWYLGSFVIAAWLEWHFLLWFLDNRLAAAFVWGSQLIVAAPLVAALYGMHRGMQEGIEKLVNDFETRR